MRCSVQACGIISSIWEEHSNSVPQPCDGKQIYLGGYRSLDCEPCTLPNEDMAMPERHGRTEKDSIALTKLRKIGYF